MCKNIQIQKDIRRSKYTGIKRRRNIKIQGYKEIGDNRAKKLGKIRWKTNPNEAYMYSTVTGTIDHIANY